MGGKSIGQSGKNQINLRDFPNVIPILHNPVIHEPPLCTLKELQDGTYSIDDLMLFNELIELKSYIKSKANK